MTFCGLRMNHHRKSPLNLGDDTVHILDLRSGSRYTALTGGGGGGGGAFSEYHSSF